MTLPSFIEPEIHVSLDGSGTFDGADDRLYKVKADPGITLDEGRDGARQLNPPRIGTGDFDLSDRDGVYDPSNAGSPYYQRLLPGRPIRYRAAHGERRLYRAHVPYRSHLYYRGRGVWPLGRHVLDDLDPDPTVGNRRASLSTLGWETLLARATVTIPLMTTPLVSDVFVAYLDAVGWPADKRDIDTSDTRLLLYYADERVPWDGMLELLAAEGPGMFGVRRDGTFYFESRNHRALATRSTTSRATFYDRIAGERTRYRAHVSYRAHRLYRGRLAGLVHTDLKPLNPLRNIFNRATYTTRQRVTAPSPIQVYQYGASLTLAANQARTLFVRPPDPFIDAVTPLVGTDYAVTSGSATVTLTYASGFLAIVRIVAGAGGAVIDGVTSTGLQLRARPMTAVGDTTFENTVDASASILKYSPIPGAAVPLTLPVQGWPEVDAPNAEAVCDAWVLRQQEIRPLVTFAIEGSDADHLEALLRLRQSDRVTLVRGGRSEDFWVNATRLTIAGAGGRVVRLLVSAEACDAISGAVWDEALWGTSDADPSGGIWGI